MSRVNDIFNFNDRLKIESLNQRLKRSEVLHSNIANAETPGFRAIGYNFEDQLHSLSDSNKEVGLTVSHPRHFRNDFTMADGSVRPDVYVRPTESVPHDGNTVDLDAEMVKLSHNQILYRATVESLNKKIGILRYAISGGR